jgi:hypothetical protein
MPRIYIGANDGKQSLYRTDQNLIFMNAGNRPIAVNSIDFIAWFRKPKVEAAACGESDVNIVLSYDFVPIIVKPGEMNVLPLQKFTDVLGAQWKLSRIATWNPTTKKSEIGSEYKHSVNYEVKSGELNSLTVEPAPRDGDVMSVCLAFKVILPDSESQTVTLLVGSARIDTFKIGLYSRDIEPERLPRVLTRR